MGGVRSRCRRRLIGLVGLSVVAASAWSSVAPPADCRLTAHRSCFNQLALDPAGDWRDYSFVVLGHIRTSPKKTGPNPNLQTNVQRLFVDDPAFVVALGDLYYSLTEDSVAAIRHWVGEHIPVPFFNAVGNHDTQTATGQDPQRYAQTFGQPDDHFTLGSELFIFLDKGATPVMSAEEAAKLKALLARAATDPEIRNIFLLSHQLFWSYYNPELAPVFRYRHPVRPPGDYRFFLDELKPLLESMPGDKHIFLMAGDIGGGRKHLQTFFHRDGRVTYVATGMGYRARDGFITVSVRDGEVALKHTLLATGKVSALEDYGLDYWITFYRDNPDLAAAADRIGPAE